MIIDFHLYDFMIVVFHFYDFMVTVSLYDFMIIDFLYIIIRLLDYSIPTGVLYSPTLFIVPLHGSKSSRRRLSTPKVGGCGGVGVVYTCILTLNSKP